MGSPYLVPVDPIMAISFHRKGDEWGITVGPRALLQLAHGYSTTYQI